MRKLLIMLMFLNLGLLLFLAGCAHEVDVTRIDPSEMKVITIEENVKKEVIEPEIIELKKPKSFHYQLQNTDFDNLLNLDVDIVIIDIDDSEFTKEQIRKLSENKIILSYLSIGEAEDYRDYWRSNLPFVLEENKNWPGNYNVKYWDSDWQQIILEKVTEIIIKGYDGIYLDKIDAYEEFETDTAKFQMLDFVHQISVHVKALNPNALIIGQNALELYDYVKYKNAIDGVGKEDTWFNDNNYQDHVHREKTLNILDEIKRDNKLIMMIDYPKSSNKILNFYDKCSEKHFMCFVSNRDLGLHQKKSCQS